MVNVKIRLQIDSKIRGIFQFFTRAQGHFDERTKISDERNRTDDETVEKFDGGFF